MGNHIANLIRKNSINNITWKQFVDNIREMNRTCCGLVNEQQEYLCFALNKKTMGEEDWQNRVRIMCFKVNASNKTVSSCKQLTFAEFMSAYAVQMTTKTTSQSLPENVDMSSSTFIFKQTADNEGLCVICMENPNELLLSCLHSFCMVCVCREMEYRPQFSCPICKTPIAKPISDSWEVPDIPAKSELANYLDELVK